MDILYPNLIYRLYLSLFFRHLDLYLPISTHVAELLNSKLKTQNSKGSQESSTADRHKPDTQPSKPSSVVRRHKSMVNGQWSNVRVIPPGIHDQYFDPNLTRASLDQLLGQPTADKTVLLTTGRLIKRKGHAWFITNVLPKLPPNTLYVIAGSGPQSVAIRQAISKHHVTHQVITLGRIEQGNLKVLYNTVDAFVQPNIPIKNDVEGFGLVLLEAALCQLPVFAAKLEGMTDAIKDGQNGTLTEPQNPKTWINTLTKFIESPTTYRPTGQAARHFTHTNFSWTKQQTDYATVLASLAERTIDH